MIKVIIWCSCSVIILEKLLNYNNNINDDDDYKGNLGTLITASQFFTVAVVTFCKSNFKILNQTKRQSPPTLQLTLLLLLFFSSSLISNWVYEFNVPVPVHGLIKSVSPLITVILNIIFLGRTYPFMKIIGVVMLTVGVGICSSVTIFDGSELLFLDWTKTAGIGLLLLSLILGALTGLVQEDLYRKQKYTFENFLFLSHAIPLPLFLFMSQSLVDGWKQLSSSGSIFPLSLLSLLCVTQYFCITNVSELAANHSSTTVNFVLTLRKFFSIVLSILIFDTTFTYIHWMSAVLVFIGTLFYGYSVGPKKRLQVETKESNQKASTALKLDSK